MITKDTGISIKFNSSMFAIDPTRSVQFFIFDENGVPLSLTYDTDGLCSLDDDRISGIHVALTCIKGLFDNVVKLRNEQLKTLAIEIGQVTGAPIQCAQIPEVIAPTGMCNHIPGKKEDLYENG